LHDAESSSPLATASALALIAAALALFFLPFFTDSVSALTGDNVTHSLPMNQLVARALSSDSFRFWEPNVSFGFPVYAEGTLALFHPWKLLLLAALPLLAAHDLMYLSSFLLAATCGFFVARTLGMGVGFALVAGLAIAFSPAALGNLYNVSYSHSIAWSALALVAFERWYAEPSRRRLVAFAVAIALTLVAGYVPTAYALFLFLGTALAIRFAFEPRQIATHAPAFAAALALGIGIAALQLLPLFELTRQSVRQDAVPVLNAFPWQNFLVGLLFDPAPHRYAPERYTYFIAPLATTLAAIALPFLPLLRDRRVLSYLGGIAVCVTACAGPGAPVFELLRTTLPGFDRLRLLSPFLFVVLVPTGVLLAALLQEATRCGRTASQLAACGVAGLFLMLLWSLPLLAALPGYRALVLGLIGAAVVGLLALRAADRLAWAPALFVVILLVEIAVIKPAHRAWLPDSILAEGAEMTAFLKERMRGDPDARAMHFPSQAYQAAFQGMVLQHWKSPNYASFVRGSIAARTPFANLLDALPFAEANGALPLAGYSELLARMQDELRRRTATAPGERAIDRFGVRWIVMAGDVARLPIAPSLHIAWQDATGRLAVVENTAVRPRYQWHAAPVDGAAASPSALTRFARVLPLVKSESQGVVEIDAPAAGRVFVPIPNYPGFSAWIDGDEVAVLAADGFGMEVPVPAGRHRLELRFLPASFHLGLCITLASGVVALAVVLHGARRA
jgi:hypothetical protein